MATDASRPAVSWLKFEPKVSNFPATKTAVAVLVASAIKTNLWFFYLFFGVVMNASRPAVSWLKFETFCTASHLY